MAGLSVKSSSLAVRMLVLLSACELGTSFLTSSPLLTRAAMGQQPLLSKSNGIGALRAARHSLIDQTMVAVDPVQQKRRPRGYWKVYENVEKEVLDFVKNHGKEGVMPTETQLRKAKLSSLSDALAQFGGYSVVAAKLGLKTSKPKGYWQDINNTIREYQEFLMEWRDMHEDPSAVPTQAQMRAEGRMDLITAIQLHGGMKRLTKELHITEWTARRTGEGSIAGVGNFNYFVRELQSFIAVNGTLGEMPRVDELENWDRSDLAAAVAKFGGPYRVADKLGLSYNPNAVNVDLVDKELKKFIQKYGENGMMPTFGIFEMHGRTDLAIQLHKIGYGKVAKRMGLQVGEAETVGEEVRESLDDVDINNFNAAPQPVPVEVREAVNNMHEVVARRNGRPSKFDKQEAEAMKSKGAKGAEAEELAKQLASKLNTGRRAGASTPRAGGQRIVRKQATPGAHQRPIQANRTPAGRSHMLRSSGVAAQAPPASRSAPANARAAALRSASSSAKGARPSRRVEATFSGLGFDEDEAVATRGAKMAGKDGKGMEDFKARLQAKLSARAPPPKKSVSLAGLF